MIASAIQATALAAFALVLLTVLEGRHVYRGIKEQRAEARKRRQLDEHRHGR